jgi:hypothetical protein
VTKTPRPGLDQLGPVRSVDTSGFKRGHAMWDRRQREKAKKRTPADDQRVQEFQQKHGIVQQFGQFDTSKPEHFIRKYQKNNDSSRKPSLPIIKSCPPIEEED